MNINLEQLVAKRDHNGGEDIYYEYKLDLSEIVINFLMGMIISNVILYIFYKNPITIILSVPLSIIFLKYRRISIRKERLRKLNVQFRDAIVSMSAALNTGYSIENSVREAYEELKLMYGESDMIIKEFRFFINQLKVNVSIEEIFDDFANRCRLEDVSNFAQVIKIARKSGGDMTKVIAQTAAAISQKIDVMREIDTVISSKKYEQSIMNIMPLAIIIYIDMSSGNLLDPLYNNAFGVIIMTVCLLLYIAAIFIAQKILDIEV